MIQAIILALVFVPIALLSLLVFATPNFRIRK